MMSNLWQRLLGAPAPFDERFSVPTLAIAVMLSLAVLVCAGMLNKRIRAREVVRG
jgi:F0F1-type ATP synthase membrane subunit a